MLNRRLRVRSFLQRLFSTGGRRRRANPCLQSPQSAETLEQRLVLTPQFNFVLIDGTPEFVQKAADDAAEVWMANFDDDVQINISLGYQNLGNNVLQSTSSNFVNVDHMDFSYALMGDRTSADDQLAVAHAQLTPFGPLPQGYVSRYTTLVNGGSDLAPAVQATTYRNVAFDFLTMTRANAKALGLLSPLDSAIDATIIVGSGVNWDFDPTNGITAGQYDMVGSMVHEIGHALGFGSATTVVDGNLNQPLANFASRPLDLFRYSAASVNSFITDTSADLRNKYFSLDGGTTSLGRFSTGVNYGDGAQGSHWKDNLGLGQMDPSVNTGELKTMSDLDLRALDVVGWDRSTSAWQNLRQRQDVNDDGTVSSIDALLVINALNSSESIDTDLRSHEEYRWLDVNGDGTISSIDALQVINFLNQQPPTYTGSTPAFPHFQVLSNVNIVNGWQYAVSASRTGILTVIADFRNSQGNIDIIAKNSSGGVLDRSYSWTNGERIDIPVQAGQFYYIDLVGTNSSVDVTFANAISQSGNSVTATGTSANDQFRMTAGPYHGIAFNGVQYAFDASVVTQLTVNGGSGTDTVLTVGSAGIDNVYSYSTSLRQYGSGYTFYANSIEGKELYSIGSGRDRVRMYGTSASDSLDARPGRTTFGSTSGTYITIAHNFAFTYTWGYGGSDRAYMYDSDGDDIFYSTSTWANLRATNGSYYNYANGFANVYAYASTGNDTAYLNDSTGNDQYYATSTYARMIGTGFNNYASRFDRTYGYASSGNDVAYLYDSAGNDSFYGRSNYGQMVGPGFFNYVRSFDTVYILGYYGGTNTFDVAGLDYLFLRYGSWV